MPRSRSLGLRLPMWLALQTFVGLLLVAVFVYVGTAASLDERQSDALLQKQTAIERILDETRRDRDMVHLQHRLDEYLQGHRDLLLTLENEQGNRVYESLEGADHALGPDVHAVNFVVPHPEGGRLQAQLTLGTHEDDHLLRGLGWMLMATALSAAIGVSIGGFYLVLAGLRPVRDLVRQTERMSAAGLSVRLDGSRQPLELQPLVQQFNALLGRLQSAYEQIEGFNANVAHELNTPLTTLITGTETSLRRTASEDELREMLASHLEEFHRLSAIVKDMLFLSQADRGASARRMRVPSLAALVRDVLDYHEAPLMDAGLRVSLSGDSEGAFDAPLVKRALSNLIGNASRYATAGSEVHIAIERLSIDRVRVAVANTGPDIGAEQMRHLFDRFYRADLARRQSDMHHGLGLAIVAAIAKMHGGCPFVESGDGKTIVGLVLQLDDGSGNDEAGAAAFQPHD